MVRKNEIVGIAIMAILCLLFIAYSQKETQNIQRHIKYQPIQVAEAEEIAPEEISIQDVIEQQKNMLKHELSNYKYPPNKSINDLQLLSGGQPIRTIIVTTWRSGSTFLGDIMNSVPGNYYHYEPLLDYGIVQIRGAPSSDSAIKTIKSLLNCNYTYLNNYLEYGMSHVYLFTHNTRLWHKCEEYPQFCWNSTFLNNFCKLFPFQSMKTVRVRLWLTEEILQDKLLNVKIILLVRDPRGTLQSRRHRAWCPGEPDCDQPSYLCSDMVSDYSAAIEFQKKYPDQFRVVRYEDLSLNPQQCVQDLFEFIGLDFHQNVKNFLESHTRINVGGVSSTFRDSKNTPFHWKTELNYTEIQYIEETCDEAMKLWGYLKTTSSDLRDFNPITSFTVN